MKTQSIARERTRSRRIRVVAPASLLVLLACSPAAFALTITQSDCPTGLYSTNAVDLKLGADMTCDIKLQNGHNLDLNGHSLSTSSIQSQGVVYCDGGSNQANVSSTVTGPGTIWASYRIATAECGTVKNLNIEGASTGILFSGSNGSNGKVYVGNVIDDGGGACGTGIDVKILDNTDTVNNNRLDNCSTAIQITAGSTSQGPRVYKNVIRGYDIGLRDAAGTSNYLRVDSNIVIEGNAGSDAMLFNTSHLTKSANVCETDSDCSCLLSTYDPENGTSCFW